MIRGESRPIVLLGVYMFETIKEKPRAYEQWEFWKNGVFGGLPRETILSSAHAVSMDKRANDFEGRFFLLASLKSNIFLPEDENEKITIPDEAFSLVFDEEIQYQKVLYFKGDLERWNVERLKPENYQITEQNVAFYLESLPIKEELKKHFGSLVSLVCDYLNRDKRRMESAQEYIMRKGCILTGKHTDDHFLEAYEDRASTTAQINALCSDKAIPPLEDKNELAGQESTTESKTETHSIEPPEEIQERFKKFIDDGILCVFPEPKNGRTRYFLNNKSASDFFKLFKKQQDKEALPQISAKVLHEWIYKRTGEPFKSYKSFYEHY